MVTPLSRTLPAQGLSVVEMIVYDSKEGALITSAMFVQVDSVCQKPRRRQQMAEYRHLAQNFSNLALEVFARAG